ncbi:PE-PGRS family protein PE_PGRS26 [Mycobacterium attenuatum]|uniref:PE-PGRS family protein PE_PGRS26 n=2 Tax=Mycobacterium TaxID=1763 RepID=A0A498PU79_9MYCO|nr:PE-PGRS family protein PE_PGRS26 [Mycobacterium attenuatum]
MNMSYVTAVPEALAAAAADITGIGSTVTAANAAVAGPTTGLLAAGADEVSAAVAGLFSSHAREYQVLSSQAAAFHEQFVNALAVSANSYLTTEAANIAPLRNFLQGLLGLVGAPTGVNGRQSVTNGSTGGHGGSAVPSSGSSGSGAGDATAAVSGHDGSVAPAGTGTAGAAALGSSSAATTSTASGATATASAAATTAPVGTTGGTGTTAAAVNPNTASSTSAGSGTTALASAATAAASTTPALTGSTGGTGVTATYTPTAQWNSGFTANYTITNTGTTPLTNWQLQFDLPTNESITNLWNGQVSQSGSHYTVTPASYNGTIEPGKSVTVGFQAAQNGAYSPPTHLLVNGQPVGGDTGGTGTGTSTGGTGTGTSTGGTGTSTGGTGTSTGGTGAGATGTGTGGTGTGSGGTGTGTGTGSTGGTGITATYAPSSQWNNGFVANYTITNTGTSPVTDWQLQFDLSSNESITNLWNGQVAHSGTHYTVTPQSYDATIAPGSSVTVGFQAAQTGTYSPPTNLLVNGQPVTGGTSTGGTGTGGTSTGGTGTGGTGTGGTSTGGTGTGGSTLITSQYGTTTIQNAYVVQNNAWNNPGGQSINVTPTGFTIATENGSAPTNGAPLGYPSIYDGWHYGTGSPGTNLPIQLSQIQTATSSVNYTYPSSGIYDASYDIWLNPTPITTGVNQQEVMIWFNHTGPIQPVGSVVGNATIDGQSFQVWKGSNGQNNVVSYVATTPINSWNNFDVMGFIDNTQTLEPVTDSWYLTSIQAGFEPWSGSVGAGVDSFSALVNGV